MKVEKFYYDDAPQKGYHPGLVGHFNVAYSTWYEGEVRANYPRAMLGVGPKEHPSLEFSNKEVCERGDVYFDKDGNYNGEADHRQGIETVVSYGDYFVTFLTSETTVRGIKRNATPMTKNDLTFGQFLHKVREKYFSDVPFEEMEAEVARYFNV